MICPRAEHTFKIPVYEPPADVAATCDAVAAAHAELLEVEASRREIGWDIDHVVPYRSPDHGGPPRQTGLHNAAPMVRFHHRLKTHADWRLRQVAASTFLWRSPHGHYWLVGRNGTHRLAKPGGSGSRSMPTRCSQNAGALPDVDRSSEMRMPEV